VRAVEAQERAHKSNADISCTGLIGSPLRFWLGKKYYDQLEEDASDRLWALYGSLTHLILEKHGKAEKDAHVERQVIADVLGWKVSAILDYLKETSKLIDYKFTSGFAVMRGVKQEWKSQLNVVLWLARNGNNPEAAVIAKEIKRMEIVALCRDWAPRYAADFPKAKVMPVEVWPEDKTRSYIEERVKLHQAAAATEGVPPICTDEERWMTDFAVCLTGKKIALKAKIATREEAEQWRVRLGADYVRDAEPRMCNEYCIYSKCNCCPWYDLNSKTTRTEPVVADVISGTASDPDHARKDEPAI
jgi:hypothetical protein